MRGALQIVGFIVSGLIALVVVLIAGLYLNLVRLRTTQYANPVADVKVAGTPEQIARGRLPQPVG